MELQFTELEIWQTFWTGMGAAGIWLMGVVFFIWVGFRLSGNLYANAEANVVMRIAATGFCLCVVYFALVWFAMTEWHANGVAGAFLDLKGSVQGLSPNGEMFLAGSDPRAPMSLMPNPPQGILLLCALSIQLMGIWMPKKS